MAFPNDHDSEINRQQQELQRLNRRRGSYAFAWWWWLWVMIIIGIVWFGGWGWGGYGGWWRTRPQVVIVQPEVSGSGITILNANNKQAFVGQAFDLRNIPVQRKISNQVFWVGVNNSTPMLVVLKVNNSGNGNIQPGSHVSLSGTVQKAPSQTAAKQEWKLSDNGAKRLETEGAYVQATEVHRSQG